MIYIYSMNMMMVIEGCQGRKAEGILLQHGTLSDKQVNNPKSSRCPILLYIVTFQPP